MATSTSSNYAQGSSTDLASLSPATEMTSNTSESIGSAGDNLPIKVGLCLVMWVVGGFIIGGNLLIIHAVMHVRKLHTLSNIYIVSLAVSDCLVSVILLPYGLDMLPNFALFGSHFGCLTLLWLPFALIGCSEWHMLLVSIDRYLYMIHPFFYCRTVNTRKVLISILFVWCFSIVYGSGVFLFNDYDSVRTCYGPKVLLPSFNVYATGSLHLSVVVITCCVYFRIMILAFQKHWSMNIGRVKKKKWDSIFSKVKASQDYAPKKVISSTTSQTFVSKNLDSADCISKSFPPNNVQIEDITAGLEPDITDEPGMKSYGDMSAGSPTEFATTSNRSHCLQTTVKSKFQKDITVNALQGLGPNPSHSTAESEHVIEVNEVGNSAMIYVANTTESFLTEFSSCVLGTPELSTKDNGSICHQSRSPQSSCIQVVQNLGNNLTKVSDNLYENQQNGKVGKNDVSTYVVPNLESLATSANHHAIGESSTSSACCAQGSSLLAPDDNKQKKKVFISSETPMTSIIYSSIYIDNKRATDNNQITLTATDRDPIKSKRFPSLLEPFTKELTTTPGVKEMYSSPELLSLPSRHPSTYRHSEPQSSPWKSVRLFASVFVCFCLFWLPYYFCLFVAMEHNVPRTVLDVLVMLGMLNSAVNFIVYATISRHFRAYFKHTLCASPCCIRSSLDAQPTASF